nr:hypothetical protein [Trentepohlia sp. YN1242]
MTFKSIHYWILNQSKDNSKFTNLYSKIFDIQKPPKNLYDERVLFSSSKVYLNYMNRLFHFQPSVSHSRGLFINLLSAYQDSTSQAFFEKSVVSEKNLEIFSNVTKKSKTIRISLANFSCKFAHFLLLYNFSYQNFGTLVNSKLGFISS